MDVVEVATALRAEALVVDERRLLTLAGDRERDYDALEAILRELDVPITGTTLVGPENRLRCEYVPQANADRLLGTTREVVILDAHEELRPNALGSVVGAVDGGGLLFLLTPPLNQWPDERDAFDDSLAAPPSSVEDVAGNFRGRLVETLRAHRGIAIADLDVDRLESDGLTHPRPRLAQVDNTGEPSVPTPDTRRFPKAAYDACRTADQAEAVETLESLLEGAQADRQSTGAHAVVLESDRGRGKSSAAGLAAGAFVATGLDVAVVAPTIDNAREVFERATEVLESQGVTVEHDGQRDIQSRGGGRIRFVDPVDVGDETGSADVVIVDEAAALPVSILESTLAADRIAFATTIHGYEGTGRGFSVRFRDRLAESRHDVTDVTLTDPIRYAPGDPIETWVFRALLLDARPPVGSLLADATPATVSYRELDVADLLADEHRLRETFGLLVLAHYRTEPNDLARLLDAPNLTVRTLEHDGHVVSVALLAREGGLDAATRADMYEGGRIRGNMLPDVLTSQLRDEAAGEPVGYRVVRIATHHAVRSRGLGSHLLERVHAEVADDVDWLGAGFGATPELLAFWHENGYTTVHCSTTRNDRSGEYSAIMLSPTTDPGRSLRDRHAERFARRVPAVFSDTLSDLDADVARALCRAIPADAAPSLDLIDHDWRVVAGAAYGPGLFDVDPGPFRRLIVRYLIENPDGTECTARQERLLVTRGLQARSWPAVAEELGYHSAGQCMRSFGDALCPLVDQYGNDTAIAVRERFDGT